jgi:hypothetical protein
MPVRTDLVCDRAEELISPLTNRDESSQTRSPGQRDNQPEAQELIARGNQTHYEQLSYDAGHRSN